MRTPPSSSSNVPPQLARLALIHPGALGDLVQALPAFIALRRHFADAHLTLCVGAELADLARSFALFDTVHGFDATAAYRGTSVGRVRAFAQLARGIRSARPDAAAVFKGAPVYALLARLSGARFRVGLTREWGTRWLTTPLPIDPDAHHEDRYLSVVTAMRVPLPTPGAHAWPPVPLPAAFADVAADARRDGVALIAVAPGGARNAKQDYAPKRWAAGHFAAALIRVHATHPLRVLLLGARSDEVEAQAVASSLPAEITVLHAYGRTSIAEARALIDHSDAYLGNDSGLMHVAGTTDTPMVVVFGPTDPRVLAPRRAGVVTLWHPARQRPCFDEVTGAVTACTSPCCIERVGVDEVADALLAALGAGQRTGPRLVAGRR